MSVSETIVVLELIILIGLVKKFMSILINYLNLIACPGKYLVYIKTHYINGHQDV